MRLSTSKLKISKIIKHTMIANIILSDALSSTSAFELIQRARSIYESDI